VELKKYAAQWAKLYLCGARVSAADACPEKKSSTHAKKKYFTFTN
jgi:hypothetical protein